MPYTADRVKETTTTIGTGTLSLGGTATGFQTFVAAVGTGATCHYCIRHRTSDEWEVGIGTVTDASVDTLARTTVLANSDGTTTAITLSAGTKDVFLTEPAGRRAVGAGGFEVNTAVAAAANAISALESGTVFSNEGATALNCHTLPAAAAGLNYTFVVQDSDGIKVTAASGDTIRNAGNVSGAAGFITNTTTGSVVTLYAINATEWIVISAVGTWTVT